MQFILYYRTHRTDILNKASYLFIPKLKEMAKEREINYEQILHCTEEEINNNIPSKDELNERIKNHALISDEKGIYCVSGKESEKIKEFLTEKIKKVNEFKGQIASKGLVKGKVILIFNRKDCSKIEKGDILVTSMTTPEMVPAMEKASAFVTDEGGITCHAAIISREMKKPCIIGTKISTQILNTGDIVEVNANKGVVKKLK